MYKTKFGHRSSGSKSSPASKTAGQTQFDFHFSSGVRKEFCLKSATVACNAVEAFERPDEQVPRGLGLPVREPLRSACLLNGCNDFFPAPAHELQVNAADGGEHDSGGDDDSPQTCTGDFRHGNSQLTPLVVEVEGMRFENDLRGGDKKVPATCHPSARTGEDRRHREDPLGEGTWLIEMVRRYPEQDRCVRGHAHRVSLPVYSMPRTADSVVTIVRPAPTGRDRGFRVRSIAGSAVTPFLRHIEQRPRWPGHRLQTTFLNDFPALSWFACITTPANRNEISASRTRSAKPVGEGRAQLRCDFYRTSDLASTNARIAASRSSRVREADSWVRILARPLGTTG